MGMHFTRTETITAQPRPMARRRLGHTVARAYFGNWTSGFLTVALVLLLGWGAWSFFDWSVRLAVFGHGDPKAALAACRAAVLAGACWPVVAEKGRLILFGLYPYDEQWRPALACVVLMLLYALSMWRASWRPWLVLVWLAAGIVVATLMWGGVLGLVHVPDDQWGGLPVTLLLSTVGLCVGFPIGILLALARQSKNAPALRGFAVAYIELARGIPLLTVLFMASVMVPLFLPVGVEVSKLLRVQVAIALFVGAYLAEVIRGGLAAVTLGQHEAADAIGLNYTRKMALVILPQALRYAVPGIVNTFISFFKATSIVVVVGIFDLMTAAKRAVADPDWQGFGTEVYLFVGLVYFIFCFSMSRYSRSLEATTHGTKR
ncbi:MAG: polar amino acid transporter, inner rane subunit [Variovorax sp.]|nr:polar amino acid transporter, inner rane subunit [Variovorax sp.]